MALHEDRLFPAEPAARAVARRLFATVEKLPIVSPHGHTDPRWYALNEAFPDPATLLIQPDHYIFRMLYSQGIALEALGIPRKDGAPVEQDSRKIWRLFADHWFLFRGTPTQLWLEHTLETVFGVTQPLGPKTADAIFDQISDKLSSPSLRPRALFESFNIEAISTTDSALDPLKWHDMIVTSGWGGKVIPAYRPDNVVDPEFEGFAANLEAFAEITGEDTATWQGYLAAHRRRRVDFKARGATSSDHGHRTARTADLSTADASKLFDKARKGECSLEEADLFRGQMLTEMARMSLEDGLVLQIHPGSFRNHNSRIFAEFGRDMGADMPSATNYVDGLRPLLSALGNERNLTVIAFTLDETTYGRELAPLAGHYPALKLGPPWWFFDSPEGMKRFRETTTETAGFYNTVGFNDDTRAYLSIPARHDVARRCDCAYLAGLVTEHRLSEEDAAELAQDLAYNLAKKAYKL
ncbi:MAG: glucuronate isomerase [Bosea sp. (in: a-proteobacteria)]